METLLLEWQHRLTQNHPLHHHTTWRVGGPAKYFLAPASIEELAAFIAKTPQRLPLYWIGLGSNLLIRDGGLDGIVISTLTGLQKIEDKGHSSLRAEAGVSCAKLARHAARLGYTGGEFLAGIPGTVGGALAMNAGCWGHETWEFVESVETINRQGQISTRSPKDFQIAYRDVHSLKEEWFVAGHFRFKLGDKEDSLNKIRDLLDKRAATQPTGDHTCGSVFRNPPEKFAAKLIEESGLKGFRLGGAFISPKHANFIVNEGHASAKDIEQLIDHVAKTVADIHGIELIREVKIIGISAEAK